MKSIAREKEIKRLLRELIPMVPMEDFLAIEETAKSGHLRHLPPSIAAWQATTSRVRHAHTEYDEMMDEGYDKDAALHFVLEEMNEKLSQWGCSRQISSEEI